VVNEKRKGEEVKGKAMRDDKKALVTRKDLSLADPEARELRRCIPHTHLYSP